MPVYRFITFHPSYFIQQASGELKGAVHRSLLQVLHYQLVRVLPDLVRPYLI